MPRRSKEDASITREKLLEAAQRLFVENGLERSSLHQIACAAGVTRGAVYWHFADKLALVEALIARVESPLQQALAAAAPQAVATGSPGGTGDPLAALRRLALAPFELIERDASARRVFTIMLHCSELIGELAPLRRHHEHNWNDWAQHMARLFQAAKDEGSLAEGAVAADAAIALLSLVDGMLRRCTLHTGSAPARCTVEAAIDALINGFRAPPQAPRPFRRSSV